MLQAPLIVSVEEGSDDGETVIITMWNNWSEVASLETMIRI